VFLFKGSVAGVKGTTYFSRMSHIDVAYSRKPNLYTHRCCLDNETEVITDGMVLFPVLVYMI
jgi:hypothetical protein